MKTFQPQQNFFLFDGKLHSAGSNSCVIQPPSEHVYEVFRVIQCVPLFIEEHLQRFCNSASFFGIYPDKEKLLNLVDTLIKVNPQKFGNIKIILWGEPDNYNVLMFYDIHAYPDAKQISEGVRLGFSQLSRIHPNIKLYQTEMRENAAKLIQNERVYEVLLTDDSGHITECSRSNIFFIRNGIVMTPPEASVLMGVTRGKIIEIIVQHRIPFQECVCKIEEIALFDSIFITGTSRRVLPVREIVGLEKTFDVGHPLLRFLEQEFLALTNEYIRNFNTKVSL